MYLRTVVGSCGFLMALLAGCASAPPRAPEPRPVEATKAERPPPAAAPTPAVVAAPTPPPTAAQITVLPTREDDLWMRIRSGFAMAELDSPLVKKHEQLYAGQPDYFRRMTERSQLYLFHIVEEVERRKLPSEIALLPMIESAFNPQAYSRSKASGIWQFIPSTGKHFGLDQNWWYDGRRNVLAATNAALDYLEKLHTRFGSWELALAAYNCGEGNVARAIAANQARGLPTDLLNLRLPDETRHYVPKLLAVKHIIADPEAFGLTLNDVPNKPFFAAVEIRKHIDVALAARFADMSVEEFTALNPAYNKRVITYNDNERLLLPASKAEMFSANMRRYGDQQLHSWQAYQGKKGESVDKIATKYGITSRELRSLNSVQEKRGKLKTAQLLLVPLHLAKPLPTAAQIAAAQPAPVAPQAVLDTSKPHRHLVQKGDTLFGLAKRYGTPVDALVANNKLEDGVVKAGQTLEIPAASETPGSLDGAPEVTVASADGDGDRNGQESKVIPAVLQQPQAAPSQPVSLQADAPAAPATRSARPAPAAKPSFYKVKRGDTLYSIAKVFQVSVADLKQWNSLSQKSKLMPGVKVKVFSAVR